VGLYEQIDRLKMELAPRGYPLKKRLLLSLDNKRQMVEPDHRKLSIRRQCDLLGSNRATLYYEPATETALNLHLMRLLDEQYLKMPFAFSRYVLTWHLSNLRDSAFCVDTLRQALQIGQPTIGGRSNMKTSISSAMTAYPHFSPS